MSNLGPTDTDPRLNESWAMFPSGWILFYSGFAYCVAVFIYHHTVNIPWLGQKRQASGQSRRVPYWLEIVFLRI